MIIVIIGIIPLCGGFVGTKRDEIFLKSRLISSLIPSAFDASNARKERVAVVVVFVLVVVVIMSSNIPVRTLRLLLLLLLLL